MNIQNPVRNLVIDEISHQFITAEGVEPFKVLQDIFLEIPKGLFVSIVGHSGCGKSTMLRIISGLTIPTMGDIVVDGKAISGPDAGRGMVFQQDAVFPWLSVRQNIEYGMKIRGVPKKQRTEEAERWIQLVGLDGWQDAYPKQLSGGMRKRVDLARVYANGPEIMLMDEPFGALDAQTKSVMQQELLTLWENAKSTVLFVTHDLEEAIFLSDYVIIMDRKPGRVKHVQKVDLPRPRGEELRLSNEFLDEKRKLYEILSDT